jgi:hypothetical protein
MATQITEGLNKERKLLENLFNTLRISGFPVFLHTVELTMLNAK